ncbi:MAG: trypsin-like serine peptidase [Boseongicola sp.]
MGVWVVTGIAAVVLWVGVLITTAAADTVPAAGRLEDPQRGTTCSASLVTPDVVLTAAHCVAKYLGAEADKKIPIVFRPGTGQNATTYSIDQIVLHPLYDSVNDPQIWSLRFDVAAVRLATPVPSEIAEPFETGPEAELGEKLFIVSWRTHNSQQPRQRACDVMPGARGLVTLACNVLGGESGAPVLRKGENGLELVAVVSSRGQILQQPIAQASNVALRLPPLLAEFD